MSWNKVLDLVENFDSNPKKSIKELKKIQSKYNEAVRKLNKQQRMRT